jgi:hypothetical protein
LSVGEPGFQQPDVLALLDHRLVRVTERDGMHGWIGIRERPPCTLRRRPAGPEVTMRHADAYPFDLHDPTGAQTLLERGGVVVTGDGLGRGQSFEEVDDERLGMVADVEDPIGAGKGRDHGRRQRATEARKVRVADDGESGDGLQSV